MNFAWFFKEVGKFSHNQPIKMDTSKEYINMCEKAVEIQERWKLTKGDYFFSHRFKNVDISIAGNGIADDLFQKNTTWLPTQSQLQGMVFNKEKDVGGAGLIDRFNNWLSFEFELSNWTEKAETWSMEQLWLAFVMKELYKKHWNGTDWIKE